MANLDPEITEDTFGFVEEGDFPEENSKPQLIRRFTLVNRSGMKVQILNYGATITSICVPDQDGVLRDVVLGYDNISGYLGRFGRNPYFGAAIGRVANRIGKAQFVLNGNKYQITINNGENHLHGGVRGFDKRIWESHVEGKQLTFSYVSKDGEEGYPGQVLAHVTYELTGQNELLIKYQATTTKPTPINLTNHSYFNLGGHEMADQKLSGHRVFINADRYTPLDAGLIATGELRSVEGTVYDLRSNPDLHQLIQQFTEEPRGYDINFCVNQVPGEVMNLVARVSHDTTKIVLVVRSDQPGVQFYTSNFLPDPENPEHEAINGKGNNKYYKYGAFCLETQNYPNAINRPSFPNSVLNPGQVYAHSTVFQFNIAK